MATKKSKKRVGIIRGGPSSEYFVSLMTGSFVMQYLPEHLESVDILITREGEWYLQGFPRKPERIFREVDVVFNALHGKYGEDGKIQQLLESFAIPYTGSRPVPSSIGMNKRITKTYLQAEGIRAPTFVSIRADEPHSDAIKKFTSTHNSPYVVKSATSGSSLGIVVLHDLANLEAAISRVFSEGPEALLEEYIPGREFTCGVVEDYDGHYLTLPPVEIILPKDKTYYDFEAKYGGAPIEVCPPKLSATEQEKLQTIAKRVHKALGLRHYSRTDMILTPEGEIYVLETNSQPELIEFSRYPNALKRGGMEYRDFLEHLIELALTQK